MTLLKKLPLALRFGRLRYCHKLTSKYITKKTLPYVDFKHEIKILLKLTTRKIINNFGFIFFNGFKDEILNIGIFYNEIFFLKGLNLIEKFKSF